MSVHRAAFLAEMVDRVRRQPPTSDKVATPSKKLGNLQIGDIVVLQDDNLVPTRWPLARVIKDYVGNDKLVRVVTVKTTNGIYKRPIHKMALLLPHSE